MTTEATALPKSPFIDETVEEPIEEPIDEEIDEEEMEEPVDDEQDIDDEELDDEELEELLDEEDDDEEEADEVQTVPHAALHKEREKRKEIQSQLQEASSENQQLNDTISKYQEAIDSIEKQLKELDLDDVIKVEHPEKLSKEMLELKAQKQLQEQQEQINNLVEDVRSEAADILPEYSMIDGNDPVQAEIVLSNAFAAMTFGMELEEAVHHAMKLLNDSLTVKKKQLARSTKPVKRERSQRSVKRKAPARRKPTAGNVSSVFNDIAGNHLQKSPFE